MLATIVIVTTANRQRVFGVENIEDLKAVGEKLERFQQLFRRNTLIIGSGNQTEIFSPSSITRLELHYTDGHGVIPEIRGADVIVAIDPAASSQVEEAKDGEFTWQPFFSSIWKGLHAGPKARCWLT